MTTYLGSDRRRSAVRAVLLTLGLVGLCSTARADLDPTCAELGPLLVDHSCFHGRNGPFRSVMARTGTSVAPATPAVDEPHTHFTVALPPGTAGVTYRPTRTSDYVIFTAPEVPLTVRDEAGAIVAVALTHSTPSCERLTSVQVVGLEAGRRYHLLFGPSTTSAIGLVIEDAWEFSVFAGADMDQDGWGDPDGVVETPCVPPAGRVADDRDCNDGDPTVNPAAPERCDGNDGNCNGVADDVGLPCDVGLGACAVDGTVTCPGETAVCEGPPPGASGQEECNGIDDDCDGTTDEDESRLCGSPERPLCLALGSDHRCGCAVDRHCGDASSGRICDLATYTCAAGCVDGFGRNGCPEGLRCTSSDFARPGTCSTACAADSDCEGGAAARCDVDRGVCVECVADADCAAPSVCDVAERRCAAPLAKEGGCSAGAGPVTAGGGVALALIIVMVAMGSRRQLMRFLRGRPPKANEQADRR